MHSLAFYVRYFEVFISIMIVNLSCCLQTPTFLPTIEHGYVPSPSTGKRKAAVSGAHVVHPQGGSRALHEYQFLPEQPNIRSETYDRLPQSHFYDPPVVTPNSRVSSLPVGGQYLHGNEQAAPTYAFQGQLSNTSIPSYQGRQQIFSPGTGECENAPQNNSFTNSASEAHFGMHQVLGSENPYISSDRRIFCDEDPSRVEKKRKVC